MRYLIIDRNRAKQLGLTDSKHLQSGGTIIINENELMRLQYLSGTAEERAESENLTLLTLDEVKQVIKDKKYQ